eukprot:Skav220129  [mRNA]  locus=scaffold731:290006:296396:- [translate_table: standard]
MEGLLPPNTLQCADDLFAFEPACSIFAAQVSSCGRSHLSKDMSEPEEDLEDLLGQETVPDDLVAHNAAADLQMELTTDFGTSTTRTTKPQGEATLAKSTSAPTLKKVARRSPLRCPPPWNKPLTDKWGFPKSLESPPPAEKWDGQRTYFSKPQSMAELQAELNNNPASCSECRHAIFAVKDLRSQISQAREYVEANPIRRLAWKAEAMSFESTEGDTEKETVRVCMEGGTESIAILNEHCHPDHRTYFTQRSIFERSPSQVYRRFLHQERRPGEWVSIDQRRPDKFPPLGGYLTGRSNDCKIVLQCNTMEIKQFGKTAGEPWRKKRAFTARYLESVWPRAYWNTGPVRHAPRACRPILPPTEKVRRRRVHRAWEEKSHQESSQSIKSKRSNSEASVTSLASTVPHDPEIAPTKHQELPRRYSYGNILSNDKLLMDKKRQEVYGKMEQIGSLRLVVAQVKGLETTWPTGFTSFQFAAEEERSNSR